jgi:hypothetical protein
MADGIQNLALADPTTGSFSAMASVLAYGAGPTDTIKLIAGSNPATPVGGEAARPIRVKVVAARWRYSGEYSLRQRQPFLLRHATALAVAQSLGIKVGKLRPE